MGFEIKTRKTKAQLHRKSVERRSQLAIATGIQAVRSTPAAINDLLPTLKIELREIASLKPPKRRMRKESKGQREPLLKCLKAVGQVLPIAVDREDRVIDGMRVVEAMRELGETHVNCVPLEHLTDEQAQFLRIALNKQAEGSEWVIDELRGGLEDIQLVGIDLTATGFSGPELDIIRLPDVGNLPSPDEGFLEPPTQPVSRSGDLWLLGEHRLLCGDALEPDSYLAVLDGRMVRVVFTDVPYNIPIDGFVSGLGKTKHKDFKMGVGEMGGEEFQDFLDRSHSLCAEHLMDGGVLFSCIDWRSVDRIYAAGTKAGLTLINKMIWAKGSGGMGGLYRSSYEEIPLFCKGEKPAINNIKLGAHGRDRTNLWSYPGANRRGSSAAKALEHHPTPKPIELVEDALLDVSDRSDLVLDPFAGSGTTLLAAERTGRVAAAIELDPGYVDVVVSRWEEMTGHQAVHAGTGLKFTELAEVRAQEDHTSSGGNNGENN
jgi:DNA modification methylase